MKKIKYFLWCIFCLGVGYISPTVFGFIGSLFNDVIYNIKIKNPKYYDVVYENGVKKQVFRGIRGHSPDQIGTGIGLLIGYLLLFIFFIIALVFFIEGIKNIKKRDDK